MTDTEIADKVYIEPSHLTFVSKIIRKERPDAILTYTWRTNGFKYGN